MRRAALLSLLVLPATARPPLGPLAPPTAPVRAAGPGLAYDADRNVIVLFGGVTDDFTFVGTWEWNGRAWQPRTGPEPSPRYNHGMVYDPHRRVVVVFGGEGPDGKALGDTWEREGGVWRRRAVDGPAPRAAFGAAFDGARRRMVIHGGFAAGGGAPYRDTWEWDGRQWTRMAVDGPPGTTFHKLAYDARRGRVVSFGGRGGRGETWEWDGRVWTRVATAGPPPRDHHAMTYDARRGQVVLFGGGRQQPNGEYDRSNLWLTDLWSWDGVRWTELQPAGPASRGGNPGLAYDPSRDRVVLWGGGLLDGIWEWDRRGWSRADH